MPDLLELYAQAVGQMSVARTVQRYKSERLIRLAGRRYLSDGRRFFRDERRRRPFQQHAALVELAFRNFVGVRFLRLGYAEKWIM
ncbi:unnamed protein product, partial [Nesidiocoris tenuis]